VSCGEWSPDGSQILLARDNGVYIVAANSGRARLLPIPIDSIGSWPATSPDGRELAFVAAYSDDSDAAAARRLTIVVSSADGTQTRDIVVQPPAWCDAFCRIYTSFLAWAPGKDIAFVLVEGDDYPERLYAISEDGTGQRLLSGEPDDVYWPTWSPDGHRIAFTYRAGRQDQLWVADDQGGDVHRVSRVVSRTSNLSGCFNSAWSSDGIRLACWGHAGGLYVVNATTGASRRIARDAYIDYDAPASWRPVR
jgi:Tol biopolymer transport system component